MTKSKQLANASILLLYFNIQNVALQKKIFKKSYNKQLIALNMRKKKKQTGALNMCHQAAENY